MKGINRAITVLERTLTRTRRKIHDPRRREDEVQRVQWAIAQLRGLAESLNTTLDERRSA